MLIIRVGLPSGVTDMKRTPAVLCGEFSNECGPWNAGEIEINLWQGANHAGLRIELDEGVKRFWSGTRIPPSRIRANIELDCLIARFSDRSAGAASVALERGLAGRLRRHVAPPRLCSQACEPPERGRGYAARRGEIWGALTCGSRGGHQQMSQIQSVPRWVSPGGPPGQGCFSCVNAISMRRAR